MRMLLLMTLLLAGCVSTSNVPDEIASGITSDARAIALYSDESPNDYYRAIYRSLAARGYAFEQENQDMGTMSTAFKEIGQGTTLKINIFVDEAEGGSMAMLRGQWGVTAEMAAGLSGGFGTSVAGGAANDAKWNDIGRPKAAFGELAVIANDLPHTNLEYKSD